MGTSRDERVNNFIPCRTWTSAIMHTTATGKEGRAPHQPFCQVHASEAGWGSGAMACSSWELDFREEFLQPLRASAKLAHPHCRWG